MSNMILSFNQISEEKRAIAGGKGGTLARLYQAGYPVPDGFVILPTAFAPSTSSGHRGDKLTSGAWAQVQTHLARIRKANHRAAFAVRSSALSEDSAQASFAGAFETVLNARTDDEIQDAIHTVRRSRTSKRVQAYSQAKGMGAAHEIAVVVQQMVPVSARGFPTS